MHDITNARQGPRAARRTAVEPLPGRAPPSQHGHARHEEAVHVFEALLELPSILPEVKAWALASLVKLHYQADEPGLAQFFAGKLRETATALAGDSESIYVELYLTAVCAAENNSGEAESTELRQATERFLQMLRTNERAAGTSAAMFDSVSLAREALINSVQTDRERIDRAEDADMGPCFEFDGPATGLVRELARLSNLATLQWYRSFGIEASPDDLLPVDAFDSETDNLRRAEEANQRYFGELRDLPFYLPLPEISVVARVSTEKLVAGLGTLKERLRASKNDIAGKRNRYFVQREYQHYYEQARFWGEAGLPVEPDTFRIRNTANGKHHLVCL